MFKVRSRISLIQNIPIVKVDGTESIACLAPNETIYTRRITPALQYLIDNNQVSVTESNPTQDVVNATIEQTPNSVGSEKGSFSESVNITEFNSQEEKDKFESSELESLTDIVNVGESANADNKEVVEEQPAPVKRGRRKKTTGGES